MSHITLVIPTLNRYDMLQQMLETLAASTRHPDTVFIIDNGGTLDPIVVPCEGNPDRLYQSIYKPHRNLGVAGSCNLAMKWASTLSDFPEPLWLHSNDDVEIGRNTIQRLEEASQEFTDDVMFVPEHGAGSAFTFFLARVKPLIEKVGFWDEKFFPAYYEDNDYAHRMAMAGIKYKLVDGTNGYIHHASSTLTAYTEEQKKWHDARFEANKQYYIEKWGGEPKK